jgi:hypothetical protein
MSEIAKKYHSDWIAFQTTPETEYWYREIDYQAAIKRIAKLEEGIARESFDIEQSLGKALGYPWYKDDPKNFPDATEESGVCVGEHVPASIAAEAARRITELEAALTGLRGYCLEPGETGCDDTDEAIRRADALIAVIKGNKRPNQR